MARKQGSGSGKEQLLETVWGDAPLTVDREAGVIRNVKLLGRVSKNGYSYSDNALAQAAKLYEGRGVFVDHPNRKEPGAERSFRDRFGEIRGVSIQADGVHGDLHYIRAHALAEQTCECAERFPRQLGMSHNADGVKKKSGGKIVVESVDYVRSVDLVGSPATNNSLFESIDEPKEGIVKRTVKAVLESALPKFKGSALSKLLEDEGLAPAEVAVESSGSADDQIKAAFKSAIMAAFDDESLDSKATLGKFKEILAAYDKLSGEGEKKDDAPAASEPTTESAKNTSDPTLAALMEQVAELKREREESKQRDAVLALFESLKREPINARVLACLALKTEADRKNLIESWPTRVQSAKPGSTSSILDGQEPGTYEKQDPKKFAALMG